jgi:uncharacterized protein (DUF1697 family)
MVNYRYKYISFLRGINIGGNKIVKMEDLRGVYESLKFEEVKTYGMSGNVIFTSSESKPEVLVRKIEGKLKEVLGFEVAVLIRTKDEVEEIIKNNPFSKLSKEEMSRVAISLLSDILSVNVREEIDRIKDNSEKYFIRGKEIYMFFPNGYGRTKLNTNFFEKKLKVRTTARTLNVINKLLAITN